ncbi:MAG: alpha-L-rhamnosidase N-terminal domain-containing protein [Prevotella sp.]|nr:alpha-L-rhamnosidase N-terminal domain-containing protein [Prevotella sp.]MCI1281857.1 alpha-L-rhamnosidase N-terminal domain-containing protein [Prevotella sp.]
MQTRVVRKQDASINATTKHHSLQNYYIWADKQNPDSQQYVVFRKKFKIQKVSRNTDVEIFADSRYLLWINGQYVMRGPCRFNPASPDYDQKNISDYLHKGNNTIVVLAHYYGNSINGHIMKAQPALTLRLVDAQTGMEFVKTDPTWKCSDKVSYQPAHMSWNSVTDNIDGRIDGRQWMMPDYDDSHWAFAHKISTPLLGNLKLNELPLPRETKLDSLELLPQRVLLERCLPVTLQEGKEIIIDYRRMALVYTKISLSAQQNSELSFSFASRYRNGKIEESFGRNNRYIAKEGQQTFMSTDQWGGHYMVLKCLKGNITINHLELFERFYPFERLGSFESNDTLLNEVWDMGVRTIEAVCDDAYGSDIRERNEWLQDPAEPNFVTTQVALVAPSTDGKSMVLSDSRLLKNLLRHAYLGQLPDGRIRATFPTDRGDYDCHYFIDDYACQFIEALRMYYEATGDKPFVKEVWNGVVKQLDWFAKRIQSDGLVLAREYCSFDNPLAYITCQGATINAYIFKAYKDAAYLAKELDNPIYKVYLQQAEKLSIAYNKLLWNPQEQAFNSAIKDGEILKPTVHAQLMALYSEIIDKDKKEGAWKWFLNNYKNKGRCRVCNNPDYLKAIESKDGVDMPVTYYWVLSEFYKRDTTKFDLEALSEIRRRWTPMLAYTKDEGTLAEVFADEKGGGISESCHNYGAVPVYFLSSYVLGVRRSGSVWKKELLINPRIGDLQYARGKVVTQFGVIGMDWQREENGKKLVVKVTGPNDIKYVWKIPNLGIKTDVFLNGNPIEVAGNIR